MGNSNGELADYWELINSNEQLAGGFIWEFCDHSIKTDKGYLFGGDFGEIEHDENFCVDGMLTSDRKIKSGALEIKAVYGGKLRSEKKPVKFPEVSFSEKKVSIDVNGKTGEITSVIVEGKEVLRSPISINISRYIDNDMLNKCNYWDKYKIFEATQRTISSKYRNNKWEFQGVVAADCLDPLVSYKLSYEIKNNALIIGLKYIISDYIKKLPRIGLEFAVDKLNENFTYIGFGPNESYCDKKLSCEYGMYQGSVTDNYTRYVRPQESGSHFGTGFFSVDGLFTVVADKDFSFSVNPYSTKQIIESKHDFELPAVEFTNVCIDLFMRGVGTNSCGPDTNPEHEVPKSGENTIKIFF